MSEPTRQPETPPAAEIEEIGPADATSLFFESLIDAVGVETVFGDPIRADGHLIIPVAETAVGGGVGDVQYATPQGTEQRQMRFPLASRGGGGGASTRPVAVVVVTPTEVKVQPILDLNRIALTGMATAIGMWRGITAFVQAMRKRR